MLSILIDSFLPRTEVEGGSAGGVAGISVVAELEIFGLNPLRQGVVDWLAGEIEDYQIAGCTEASGVEEDLFVCGVQVLVVAVDECWIGST